MSTLVAIPAFNLLAQPIQDVLTGSARVGGVFATKENRVSINTVTADGIILSAQALGATPSTASTTLSVIHAPAKGLVLSSILGSGGATTLGATLTPASVPGLTASLSADPFAAASASPGSDAALSTLKASVDYAPPGGLTHFRASAGGGAGIDVSAVFAAAGPTLLIGGSATIGAASASGGSVAAALTGWSIGGAWSRMVESKGDGPASRQQLTATLTEAGTSKGRSLGIMAAQQVGASGRTTVAADCVLPLRAAKGVETGPSAVGSVALAVSHRLDTGGLAKAKVSHDGAISLLYEARIQEAVRLGTTVHLDPSAGFAPRLGISVDLSP